MKLYISQIQGDLKALKLYAGAIDGVAGNLTMAAIDEAVKMGIYSPEVAEEVKNRFTQGVEFTLTKKDKRRLKGVNSNLVKVVTRAAQLTKQDFTVLEGLRTKKRQLALVRKGASRTMKSKHITGHAVDLAPLVGGKVTWSWDYYYLVAEAMRDAAEELNIKIRWGGNWKTLNHTGEPARVLVKNYTTLRRKQGRKAFIDGPHFELV